MDSGFPCSITSEMRPKSEDTDVNNDIESNVSSVIKPMTLPRCQLAVIDELKPRIVVNSDGKSENLNDDAGLMKNTIDGRKGSESQSLLLGLGVSLASIDGYITADENEDNGCMVKPHSTNNRYEVS